MSGGSGRYVDTTLVSILLFFYLTIVPDEKRTDVKWCPARVVLGNKCENSF